ncbi:hypothetical protein KCU71_g6453, partial [Aureobasidium melanogenum]
MEDPRIIQEISSLSQDNMAQFLQEAHTLLAQRYDNEQDEQCIQGSHYLLQNYPVSPLLRTKLYALISMASEDWHDAEHYRKRAESIFTALVKEIPEGTEEHVDIINMRSELNTLAAYQLENEPAVDDDDEDEDDDDDDYPEPLPQSLVVPDLVAIVGRDGTQEEYQRVQYLIEDCEDADEIYDKREFAACADALQQILDSGSVSALVALKLCILISSVVADQKLAKVNLEIAEVLWEEQRDEWESQMPPDIDSFMQATRHALDLLSKKHQGAATS